MSPIKPTETDLQFFRVTVEEINSLLKPFIAPDSLCTEQSQQVQSYLSLLLKWNERINLTSVRSAEEIVTRHFGESFFAARLLFGSKLVMASAVDVGSGAGFPGLPLKIWAPQTNLTLIESNLKKVTFLREAVRKLDLKKTEVLAIRAEDVKSKYAVVTLRAVERFEQMLPVAAGLVERLGVLGLLIGESQISVAKELVPHFVWCEPLPSPLSKSRVLLIGQS